MDELMDGWIVRWVGRWREGGMDELMDGWMNRCVDG